MSIDVQRDEYFQILLDAERARWWNAVQKTARATLTLTSGTRLYVSELFDELAELHASLAFLEVHVVSSATGGEFEVRRSVHVPGLRRLIPIKNLANVAPIVDDGSVPQVPA